MIESQLRLVFSFKNQKVMLHSKRMIREVKNNKFGVGSKLELEIITESGDSIRQTHPVEIDQLMKGTIVLY